MYKYINEKIQIILPKGRCPHFAVYMSIPSQPPEIKYPIFALGYAYGGPILATSSVGGLSRALHSLHSIRTPICPKI